MCAGFVVLFFLKEIPLNNTRRSAVTAEAPEDASAQAVNIVVAE
jgi:hypothetical protein